jgi:hypothetical protein
MGMDLLGKKAGFRLWGDRTENEVLVADFPFRWVDEMPVLILLY